MPKFKTQNNPRSLKKPHTLIAGMLKPFSTQISQRFDSELGKLQNHQIKFNGTVFR